MAIVGQTGAGKSTLTKLVNRIYDTSAGQVLVDGIDVREWSLESLRGQISTIEQDVFLFSRTIAENIAFGASGQATRADIEQAAREAQAHDFIMGFPEGYDTVVGERGVTLSGGQRQRIAIARAFLTNPRILVLDDSTSAIDSATEDQIQRAMRRVLQGRTTLLITHRLSQILLGRPHPGAAPRPAGRSRLARGAAGPLRGLPPDFCPLRQRRGRPVNRRRAIA